MPAPIEGVDGNWRCHSCNNINLGVRDKCNRCGLPKGLNVEGIAGMVGMAPPPPRKGPPIEGVDGNWRCTSCSNINFGVRDKCNRCGNARQSHQYVDGSGHVYNLGSDGQLGMGGGLGSSFFGQAAAQQLLSSQTTNTKIAQLEAQITLLVQRQMTLENQVQTLQNQVAQQSALLSTAGLTPMMGQLSVGQQRQ